MYLSNATETKKLTGTEGGHGNYYTLVGDHRREKVGTTDIEGAFDKK